MFQNIVQRSLSVIPLPVVFIFILGLCLQLSVHWFSPKAEAVATKLKSPPSVSFLSVISLGEPEVFAKLLMLWLQAFDNQPGISVPFSALDYHKLEAWLDKIIKLDPKAQYPMLVASRIYTEVPDKNKQKQMMAFVYQQFLLNPKKNWPWLAHVTVLAKHRLEDSALALKFAHVLADKTISKEIPAWVRQLQFIILEDAGELETFRILAGGLIQDKSITDPSELKWLEQRLEQLSNADKTPAGQQ